MKSFDIRTKIYFGDNALDRLIELPYKKVLIITDPFIEQSGLLTLITERLQQAFIDYSVFSDVVPDPPLEKIEHGVKVLLDADPDCVIAIGGGSAIDSAKSIREFGSRASGKHIALIAIPTTSGTGSEVTSFAVVSDVQNNIKYPLVSDSMLPTEAILDAELVKSVPASVTADTGMDVLTHAIEAYVSINNNEFSAALSISPNTPDIIAATIRIITSRSLYCSKNTASVLFRLPSANAFLPNFFKFASAWRSVRPFSVVPSSLSTVSFFF